MGPSVNRKWALADTNTAGVFQSVSNQRGISHVYQSPGFGIFVKVVQKD
jgi:hypothetical protein